MKKPFLVAAVSRVVPVPSVLRQKVTDSLPRAEVSAVLQIVTSGTSKAAMTQARVFAGRRLAEEVSRHVLSMEDA